MKTVIPQRWFLSSLMLLFLFVAAPLLAAQEGVIKDNVVNVRQGPGTSYGVVTQVKAGQVFTVLEQQGNWLKVRLHTGQEGWIREDLLEVREVTGAGTAVKKVTVTGNLVNLRKGPGTNYAQVGQVKAGAVLSVLEEKNDWLRVEAAGIGQAWIAKWLVSDSVVAASSQPQAESSGGRYIVITGTVVNVRSGPGTNYKVVTKIGLNEKHDVISEQDGWYKIRVGNQEGWVSGTVATAIQGQAQPQPQNPAPSQPAASDVNKVEVSGNVVNVRQQGNLDAAVIAKVYAGQVLSVTGKQGDWYQVELEGGGKGWIASWLAEPLSGVTPSRGTVQEQEVLLAPIADGKTFKVVDFGGRAILVLEGWSNDQYQVKEENNTISLDLEGPTERNYEGKITSLGISKVRIYPQGNRAKIEVTFTIPPAKSVTYDNNTKVTKIQVGTVASQGLQGKVIVVDPGHSSVQPGGWLDPGAIGPRTGLKEKDVNLSVALKLKSLLEQAGARVVMTHTGSTELSLAGRAAVANNLNADIFVSVHANSSETSSLSGHTTYYYAPASNPVLSAQQYSRQKLATLVQREMVKVGGRKDMGVLQANYAVLRETTVPSILVETAFLSDREEEILLGNEGYRHQLAVGIFNGIKAYFE